MLRGTTFDKQVFTSTDMAMMIRRFFNNVDGILSGCNISKSSNIIKIDKGYFIVAGRLININLQEQITVAKSGKLVFRLDFNQINTDNEFKQGKFTIVDSLKQEDVFDSGKIYDLYFADVTFANGNITKLDNKIKLITGDAITTSGGTINGNLNVNGSIKVNNNNIPSIISGTEAPEAIIERLKEGDIYLQYN